MLGGRCKTVGMSLRRNKDSRIMNSVGQNAPLQIQMVHVDEILSEKVLSRPTAGRVSVAVT